MNMNEINEFTGICVMGLGNLFNDCIQLLEQYFRISYVCDNNLMYANTGITSKYRFISPADLPGINNVFVIVTSSFQDYIQIDNQLSALGIPNCYFRSIQGISFARPVIQLSKLTGPFEDQWGNVIDLSENVQLSRNSFVIFGDDTRQPIHHGRGRNNRLHIGKNANLSNSFLLEYWGDDCTVDIGNNTHLGKVQIVAAQGACFQIGAGSSIQGLHAVLYEGGRIIIGEDCMFSHNVQLWQTDTHPIFDKKTGKRINKVRSITIGNHVWMGANAILLGGADIGSGSIVGMNSVSSSKIPSHVIIAGNPARIIRRDIVWADDQLYLSDITTIGDCRDPVLKSTTGNHPLKSSR